ncbi:MAG: peptidoglycan-associated lipoprotein, partial [Alphaproteobacteria bacterium]
MKSGKGFGRVCIIAGAVFLAAGVAACSKQKHKQAGLGSPAAPGTPAEFSTVVGDRVLFTTDSSELTPEARAILRGQAKWLA